MSDVIDAAVEALSARMSDGFAGVAKFVIGDTGSVMIDADGVRAGDEDATVTLTADLDTFKAMMEGELDPTSAFMSGKLQVDGDMGLAMQLGAALG